MEKKKKKQKEKKMKRGKKLKRYRGEGDDEPHWQSVQHVTNHLTNPAVA